MPRIPAKAGLAAPRLTAPCLAALAALGLASPAAADQVTVTGLNWDAARVISQVLTQVIEKELGAPTAIREADTDTSLVSMDAGDGRLDVFPDIWMPNQQKAWETYVEERGTIAHNAGYEAVQGFFLPTATARALGIATIEDLKSPEIARRFDTDGNGLGEYWAGEETWGATRLNRIKMKSYGLDGLWEPWIASNQEFKAELETATAEGRPILFYHWTPEWVFSVHDLTQVEEPAYRDGCDTVYTPSERDDWLEASSFPCAFETSRVYVFHSRSLETRFPKVAAFLAGVTFDPDVINGWVTETGVAGKSPEEVARQWLVANPRIVAGWLAAARAQ
jgi:glycine betaine/proline transport system substrate-binding protein